MIEFIFKTDFEIGDIGAYERWIIQTIESEDLICGDLSFTFCTDSELDRLNQEYLGHTDWTDIISFDMRVGDIISGDIFISTERVRENAKSFGTDFDEEMRRVIIHGVLHIMGYLDDSAEEQKEMRKKEEQKLLLFHVEQ